MISIILHSGEWDRIYHAFTIASTYSALGESVKIFLTYWAIDSIVNGKIECGDEKKNQVIEKAVEAGKIKKLEEIVRIGKEFGDFEVIACSGSMDLLGYGEKDLPEWIDRVGGLAEQLMGGDKVIFI